MITSTLSGGLGNQLFQLATLDTMSKQTGRTIYLEYVETPKTHHSNQDYFQTIFSSWKSIPRMNILVEDIHEISYEYREWNSSSPNIRMNGYFQNYRYVSQEFLDKLDIPTSPSTNCAFLHIRGGDYVNNPFHTVGLEEYYKQSIGLFPEGTMFHIFTNDIPYAKTLPFLNTIHHTFIEEQDEVLALSLMKSCALGGICANSTFSWWGAYLNRENRTLVLPSKWFNDSNIYLDGYFFPGSTVVYT